MMRAALLAILIACAATHPSAAEQYYREELRIPMPAAGPRGLEALLVRPPGPQAYPLALISHGTSRDAQARHDMTPYWLYRQAIEFARRGFASLVVMRRGFGSSGGVYADGASCCTLATYLRSSKASTDDLHAAIAAMKGRADVTTQGMIAIGVSSGGLATVSLTSDPPPGLAAAVNFAGGLHRASLTGTGLRNGRDETALVDAFATLGRRSRTPMLWIYAENDPFFRPDLAHRLHAAFIGGGGRAQLIDAPTFGSEGHDLFSKGTPIWTRMVDDFLHQQNLGSRDLLAAPTPPALPPPPRLSENGRAAFADYLAMVGPHKAFAASPRGDYGFQGGMRLPSKAQSEALARCAKHAPDCSLYAIEDELAATGNPGR
jgi:dienelactone hydrolase